jgi:hypothetical protein
LRKRKKSEKECSVTKNGRRKLQERRESSRWKWTRRKESFNKGLIKRRLIEKRKKDWRKKHRIRSSKKS